MRLIRLIYLIIRHNCIFLIAFLPVPFFRIFRKLYKENSQKQARRLVRFLEEAGPVYIKLGQMLSTRSYLFSEIYLTELNKLRDNTKAYPNKLVYKIIEEAFQTQISNLFLEINPIPVASGSIAQVYKGKLPNNQVVAIKVIKPNTFKLFQQDIKLLGAICKGLEGLSPRSRISKPSKIIKHLQYTMQLELNLKFEAASMDEIRENFKSDPDVYIPQVYWEYVATNVLVQEWVDGIKIDNLIALKGAGFDLDTITKKLTKIFFYQSLRDGFFHGDIHPGNMFVMKNGAICLIDFGIMGRLSPELQIYIKDLFIAFLNKDYKKAARIHFKAGWVNEKYSVDDFALACRGIVEQTFNLPQEKILLGKILENLFIISQIFEMEIQESLISLQKSLLYLENIGRTLSPKQNMWILSQPIIMKYIRATRAKDYLNLYGRKNYKEIVLLKRNLMENLAIIKNKNESFIKYMSKSYKLNLILTFLVIIAICVIMIEK
ncbi:2-polyprenylphenol 6-hydroxylase [Candidatus Hepatincolaceae symbiont of Richtersius coronifer]